MGIRSTVIENQVHETDGQAFDGFSVVIHDDEEFGGTYHFTHTYDAQSAHEFIFSGGCSPDEGNGLNLNL